MRANLEAIILANVHKKWYYLFRTMEKLNPNTVAVMLIDDDPSYVSVLEHQLSGYPGKHFTFSWVNDGEQAVGLMKNGDRTDLIIMDYYLANSNGIETTKKILEAGFSVPIIFLTSNKDFRLAIEAMKYGIEDYLVKEELSDTILAKTILNTIDRFHLHQQMKEMEKERLFSARSSEAIQELIVTMCHEFNNPLAAIKISADILSRQNITQDERSLLQKLNKNITSLEQQIIKLRDLNSEDHQELEPTSPKQ
jgi:response regulator of citrate/malate metabolism